MTEWTTTVHYVRTRWLESEIVHSTEQEMSVRQIEKKQCTKKQEVGQETNDEVEAIR